MRNSILVILILIVSLAKAQDVVTKNVSNFYELKVFDKIEVKLIKGSEDKVEITGTNRNDVVVENKDNILKIKMSISNTWERNNIIVTVYYTNISKIDVNEGAKVSVNGVLEAQELDFRAQEGADIYAEIKTNKIVARAVSGGGLHINGIANTQEVVVKAGGQYLADDLKTENTTVSISAGGSANIHASEYVKANTTAGGIIKIYGKPKKIDSKKRFGGKIIEAN